mmetsp:Transcript_47/g.130  ORF Transcript_47/g.130 Transcript_47/m.130 type:complete len:223 (+) Transcript_47:791-1459(+)
MHHQDQMGNAILAPGISANVGSSSSIADSAGAGVGFGTSARASTSASARSVGEICPTAGRPLWRRWIMAGGSGRTIGGVLGALGARSRKSRSSWRGGIFFASLRRHAAHQLHLCAQQAGHRAFDSIGTVHVRAHQRLNGAVQRGQHAGIVRERLWTHGLLLCDTFRTVDNHVVLAVREGERLVEGASLEEGLNPCRLLLLERCKIHPRHALQPECAHHWACL